MWSPTVAQANSCSVFSYSDISYVAEVGNPDYLWGTLATLTDAGECFFYSSQGTLYLRTPGDVAPNSGTVEMKKRAQAFDLRDRSYIEIVGIEIFAANIVTNDNSTGIILDGIKVLYPSHFTVVSELGWTTGTRDTGMALMGRKNRLKNCEISFSAGNGVTVFGQDHVVIEDRGRHSSNGVQHEDAQSAGTINLTLDSLAPSLLSLRYLKSDRLFEE